MFMQLLQSATLTPHEINVVKKLGVKAYKVDILVPSSVWQQADPTQNVMLIESIVCTGSLKT